ncbi:MAG: efflux RND transporter periplasmic adaptor subunit [Polyangiales bacterium]
MSKFSLGDRAPGVDANEVPAPAADRLEASTRVAHPDRARARRTLRVVIAVGLALTGLFLLGYLPKRAQRARLEAVSTAQARAVSRVATVAPKRSPRSRPLKLPAQLEAHEHTVVHARANGYVRRWLVDLGDAVDEGQLLAELDTPELDRELEQARAHLAQADAALSLARASHAFSRSSLARYQALGERKLSSAHELEQYQAEAEVQEAKVRVADAERASQAANLRRLEQLKAFARVLAPFAGTITARTVERGALVSAGAGSPLFEVARLDPVRVTLDAPQSWAVGVKPGLAATVGVAEYPGRTFQAKVARTAARLDPKTRTLRVELEVPNADGALLAGMYGSVGLSLEQAHDVFVVPANAVLASREGTRVATVGEGGKVKLRPVTIERDNGAEVEIAEGLDGSEKLIANPSPAIVEGAPVEPSS